MLNWYKSQPTSITVSMFHHIVLIVISLFVKSDKKVQVGTDLPVTWLCFVDPRGSSLRTTGLDYHCQFLSIELLLPGFWLCFGIEVFKTLKLAPHSLSYQCRCCAENDPPARLS